ncbi:MAG: hypothetical protein HOW73_43590 [Polyangiaceae bacterium]|nr:hypothetical protein [Polyangiaceae bacterium]
MKTSTNGAGETTWTIERTNERGEVTEMCFTDRKNGQIEILRKHYGRGPVQVRGGGVDGFESTFSVETARKAWSRYRAYGYC